MECWRRVYSRSLAAQQRSRAKEALAQNKSMQTTMAVGRKAIQVGDMRTTEIENASLFL